MRFRFELGDIARDAAAAYDAGTGFWAVEGDGDGAADFQTLLAHLGNAALITSDFAL